MTERKLFNPNNHKTTRGCLEDAAIIGAHAAFGVLAATGFRDLATGFYGAFVAFGLAFTTQLIYERKIKKSD